jgi:hypothetical protein
MTPPTVFLSYCHRDEDWKERIAGHLGVLGDRLKVWDDRQIRPGEDWFPAIQSAIAQAQVVILVISDAFLNSPFIKKEEVPRFLALRQTKGLTVLPVIARPCAWQAVDWLASIQCYPKDGRALSKVRKAKVDEDLAGLALKIRDLLTQIPASSDQEQASIRLRTEDAKEKERPPYKGIEFFRTEDEALFFGRTSLTQQLIASLQDSHFLAILGPSGIGKSSVVRAGLIPALHREGLPGSEHWDIMLLKPGRNPLRELAAHLLHRCADPEISLGEQIDQLSMEMDRYDQALADKIAKTTHRKPIVLIIDQFEEIFTQTSSEPERRAFFANLLRAADLVSPKLAIVVVLRADFYSKLVSYPSLANRITACQVFVTSMSESDLWHAVTGPAVRSGFRFEEGLVDKLLWEMRENTAALPMLQQTLLELWERREGATLTVSAYQAIGGVKGAIANWAESVFEKLNTTRRDLARHVLVELVQPDAGSGNTRRHLLQSEINFSRYRASEIEEVVEQLIQNRLLTTDRDPSTQERFVEIAHESLLHEWPRFRNWLEESRASRMIYIRLQERMNVWERFRRDPGSLLRGAELEEVERWSREHGGELSSREKEYLEASIKHRTIEPESQISQPPRLWTTSGGPILDIVHPWDLSQTGWSVVFAPDLDPRVRSALGELLEHRRQQATRNNNDYYQECSYRGESTSEFLHRHGAKLGMMADPNFFPYYILLVGDPNSLPYELQSELDVNYAVGRICFEQIEDYASYARSVVRSEMDRRIHSRDIVLFGTEHYNDLASEHTAWDLVHRLAESIGGQKGPWTVREVLGAQARKEKLRSLLGGAETPAFLFTACHGLGISEDDGRQADLQGALVCQDWPGPDHEEGIDEEHWFAAADVQDQAYLHGLIVFFYSCFSVGTPRDDSYDRLSIGRARSIAPQALISRLPQRLLSHKSGGALAVIGHVDRSCTSGLLGSPKGEGIGTILNVLRRLLNGHTVGWAMEYLNNSHAALASIQANLEQNWYQRKDVGRELWDDLWVLRNDARNFMVFGDPAVRLPGVGEPR